MKRCPPPLVGGFEPEWAPVSLPHRPPARRHRRWLPKTPSTGPQSWTHGKPWGIATRTTASPRQFYPRGKEVHETRMHPISDVWRKSVVGQRGMTRSGWSNWHSSKCSRWASEKPLSVAASPRSKHAWYWGGYRSSIGPAYGGSQRRQWIPKSTDRTVVLTSSRSSLRPAHRWKTGSHMLGVSCRSPPYPRWVKYPRREGMEWESHTSRSGPQAGGKMGHTPAGPLCCSLGALAASYPTRSRHPLILRGAVGGKHGEAAQRLDTSGGTLACMEARGSHLPARLRSALALPLLVGALGQC